MKRLFLFLILWSAPAPAAVVIVCQSVDKLDEGTGECSDNKHFGQAGLDCMQAFDQAVQQQSKAVAKLLGASNQAQVDQAGNSQNHNFAGSQADYQIAQKTLAELIVAAKAARATVDGYLNHIYYPEDFDAPREVIGDPMEYLDHSPCYAENEKGLKDILAKMDRKIAELEKAKGASSAKGNTSSNRQGNTNSLNPSAQATAGGGKGAPSGKAKGTAAHSASDITGIQDDQKKQQK